MTPFLRISTTYGPRRLENTQIIYGNKKVCKKFVGKIFGNIIFIIMNYTIL